MPYVHRIPASSVKKRSYLSARELAKQREGLERRALSGAILTYKHQQVGRKANFQLPNRLESPDARPL